MEIIQIEIEKQNWLGWYCNNVGDIIQIQKKLVHHESSFGNGFIHLLIGCTQWLIKCHILKLLNQMVL
jgi:hypothetical protein